MINIHRKNRLWRTSATLGALAAFAVVLGASGRGDASPNTVPLLGLPKNPPPMCEPSWFTTAKAPMSCSAENPPVKLTMTTKMVNGCPQTTCTHYEPVTGGYANAYQYACKNTAIANGCHGTPVVGTVTPLYYVASLIYSPPGCTSTSQFKCGQTSTVDYQTSSSNGAQTSTQSSFQQGVKVEATASVGNELTGSLSTTASFGFQSTAQNGSSTTITKKSSFDLKVSGNQDGINHDQDLFVLIVKPLVAYSQVDNDIQWTVGTSADTFQYLVSVADLKNPASNPARMKTLLDAGFTTADFQTILAQNPFSNGPTTIDPNRYVATTWRNVPYETPDTSSECNNGVCSCVSIATSVSNDLTTVASQSTQKQYSVGLSVSASSPKAWPVSVKATVSGSMTWTNTASSQNTTSSTQSANMTVQCPSVGYTGPQMMDIYWDTLYGAFMFTPHVTNRVNGLGLHVGHVTTSTGAIARHTRVDLTYGGKTYHTFTNKNGDYTFDGVPAGEGQITIGGKRQVVTLGSASKTSFQMGK